MKTVFYFCLCIGLFGAFQPHSIEAATYEYDNLGRVTQATNADGSCVTYIYDANGNIVEIKVTNTADNMEDTIGNSNNADDKTDIGKNVNVGIINNREQSGETGENVVVLGDEGTNPETEPETDAQNDIDEEMPEEDDGAKTVIDQVEERIEKQNEAEDKNNTGKVLSGLLLASALGGIAVCVAKKRKKEKADNE
ncbi:MAG: RHS repeat protein [Lachnospiraceae bacterium]|nr:RHS repeat protein [Lachnospiraceae bacterium]